MVAIAVVCASLVAQVAAGPQPQGWLDGVISVVFDPAWNLEHGPAIWALVVTVLFLSGVGFPLPEDIPLTLAGFTTFKQANETFVFAHFASTFFIVVIPILAGDLIAYGLGRRLGRNRAGLAVAQRARFRIGGSRAHAGSHGHRQQRDRGGGFSKLDFQQQSARWQLAESRRIRNPKS